MNPLVNRVKVVIFTAKYTIIVFEKKWMSISFLFFVYFTDQNFYEEVRKYPDFCSYLVQKFKIVSLS